MKYFLYFFLLTYCNQHYTTSKVSTIKLEIFNSTDANTTNCKTILLEILQNSCFLNEIQLNKIILVNMVKNNTNSALQTTKITKTLIDVIKNDMNMPNVISMEQLYCAYRELETVSEEILDSYAFSIEIAHYLKADYIVYSIVYGNFEKLSIELQLILTKTGEILRVIYESVNYNDFIFN